MLRDHTLYRFGDFTLDPIAKVLFRNGDPVHMTRKAVETLLVLVEHAGQVLTKEEIMRAVWADRVVEDANLAQNIAVIRKTLAATKGSPAWIETFPGRGYRLEGPVTSESGTPAAPAAVQEQPAPSNPARKPARWVLAAVAIVMIAAVGLVVLLRTTPEAAPSSTFTVTPVTRLAGKEFQPAVSPDGGTVAFLWQEEGSSVPAVWVSPAAEPAPRALTKTTAHHSSPVWSPDGKSIAFLRIGRTGTDVLISSVADGRERLVASVSPPDYGFDNQLLDWSPDGQWLALSHAEAVGKPLGILLISTASDERRWLTRPGTEFAGDVNPRFSPDGSRVSFIRTVHRSQQDVFVMPLAGGAETQITHTRKRVSSHDWMPGGSALVVASDRGGEFRLWRVPIGAPRDMQPIGIYGEFPIQISLARKASALIYTALQQDRNIWRLNLTDRSWKRLIASTAQDASPQYSPDGDRICFRSDRSGEEQLWVTDADGGHPVQITRGAVRPSVGRWAPDGKSVVFNNPVNFEIYLAKDNESGQWTVTGTGARGAHPAFSADGKSIYVGGSAITTIPSVGGPATTLASTRAEALAASADGKYLYYVPDPTDTSLWRLRLDTRTTEKVLDGKVPGCTSCYALAPDGIYYLGTSPQSFDQQAVFFHSFGARMPAKSIVEYPEPLWPQGSGPFSLSPDRRSLLVVRVAPSNSDAMLVAPFR